MKESVKRLEELAPKLAPLLRAKRSASLRSPPFSLKKRTDRAMLVFLAAEKACREGDSDDLMAIARKARAVGCVSRAQGFRLLEAACNGGNPQCVRFLACSPFSVIGCSGLEDAAASYACNGGYPAVAAAVCEAPYCVPPHVMSRTAHVKAWVFRSEPRMNHVYQQLAHPAFFLKGYKVDSDGRDAWERMIRPTEKESDREFDRDEESYNDPDGDWDPKDSDIDGGDPDALDSDGEDRAPDAKPYYDDCPDPTEY